MSNANNQTPMITDSSTLFDILIFVEKTIQDTIDAIGQCIVENVDIKKMKEFVDETYNLDQKTIWASLLLGQYGWAILPDKYEMFFYKPIEKLHEQYQRGELSEQTFEQGINTCIINQLARNWAIIFNSIDEKLFSKDADKLVRVKEYFQHGCFFECALLLIGIIDSINIKVAMNDGVKTQGLPAFKHIWENHLSKYFHKELKSINLKDGKLKDKLSIENKNIYDDIKCVSGNIQDAYMDIGCPAISLATCFCFLYRTEPWNSNYVPPFHRSWLVHGMYDIEDVDDIYCFKLLTLLYAQTQLYQTLSIKYTI